MPPVDPQPSRLLRPGSFRAVLAVRRHSAWLVTLVILLVASSALDALSAQSRFALTARRASPLIEWLAAHHAAAWFPVVVGATVFLLLRLLLSIPERDDIGPGFVLLRLAAAVATVLVALLALRGGPGTLASRYAPTFAAVVLTRVVRLFEDRRPGLRRPTQEGFRPSWTVRLDPRLAFALDAVHKAADFDVLATSNLDDFAFDDAAALFTRRGRTSDAAYAVAKHLERLLTLGRLADAERVVTAAQGDAALSREPAYLAARSRFLRTVGLPVKAEQDASDAVAARAGRAPAELVYLYRDLRAQVHGVLPSGTDTSDRRRVSVIWRQHPAAVLTDFVVEAELVQASSPRHALALAERCVELTATAMTASAGGTITELMQLHRTQARALALAAHCYEQQGDRYAAAMTFSDAHDEYAACKDRLPAAACLIKSFVHALRSGYDGLSRESHALDMLRVGLQIVEDDRGSLRSEPSRAAWFSTQRELYTLVLDVVSSEVRFHHDKAAELALWLTESLRRSSLSALLNDGAPLDDAALVAALADLARLEFESRDDSAPLGDRTATGGQRRIASEELSEARQALADRFTSLREAHLVVEPTSVESARDRLGRRVGLSFHTTREDRGWIIYRVLSTREGISVTRSTVERGPKDDEAAWWLSPLPLLDALASGDPARLDAAYRVPLDDHVWAVVADAFLPRELAEIADGDDVELVVVPDGPVHALPLAGLRLADGRRLVDVFAVAFTPALSMLSAATRPRRDRRPEATEVDGSGEKRSGRLAILVAHVADQLEGSGAEQVAWTRLAAAGAAEVRRTRTADAFTAALAAQPRPDVATVASHGELAASSLANTLQLDERAVLSSTSALGLHWPDTVVFGSCYVSAMAVNAAQVPLGFPTACLLRGATTVIGGVARIHSDDTSEIVSALVPNVLAGGSPLHALRRAMTKFAEPADSAFASPPGKWASLVAWTVSADESRHVACNVDDVSTSMCHWDSSGLPTGARVPSGTLHLDAPLSRRLEAALLRVQELAGLAPVDSAVFLRAAVASDAETWEAHLRNSDLSPSAIAAADAFGETGVGVLRLTAQETALLVSFEFAESLLLARGSLAASPEERLEPERVVLAAAVEDGSMLSRMLEPADKTAERFLDSILASVPLTADEDDPLGFLATLPSELEHGRYLERIVETPPRSRLSGRATGWVLAGAAVSALCIGGGLQDLARAQKAIGRAGWLGAAVHTSPSGGAEIRQVVPTGPAASAGLTGGDIVTELDGLRVASGATLVALVRSRPPGTRVVVRYVEGGVLRSTTVVLGRLP